ncbi:ABC transporter permease [Nocardia alni]|uniref:ABC transporter permease n=1 Tax=Nocardia alni TaxID=2815723 RepID=UPI001C21B4D1|nr:ABC transporter permease [Nocardia alni]
MTTLTTARADRIPIASERSISALVLHTVIQTQRLLLRWARSPVALLETLIIPCLLLVMLDVVVGGQIRKFTGSNPLDGSVPLTAVVGALSGAVGNGILLGRERDAGLLARFWVLPVHRASGPAARVLAEGARILAGTVTVVIVGCLLGFRFHGGIVATVVFLCLPVLFGLAFATIVTATAVYTAKATLVEGITVVTSLMMFFSTGFVPLAAYPPWIRPVVHDQPMSVVVDTMHALATGSASAHLLTFTLIWSVGMIGIFAVPAAIGYRRASRR